MSAQIPTRAREIVHARSQGRCERCGQHKPLEMSHRVAKGMGGSTEGQGNPALYCHLCHDCHVWVEAWPTKALSAGWKVPPGAKLEEWPVHMHDGNYLLDAQGGFSQCEN